MTATAAASVDLVERQRAQSTQGLDFHVLYRPWERTNQALWHLPRDVRAVLDVGCNEGQGSLLFRFAYPKARVEGVECVPERAEVARQYCDKVYECFLQDAPLAAESFDAIYAGEVVEHVPYEAVDDFIGAAHRALRPGGRLILTTPNPDYIRLWMTGRKVTDDPGHVSVWPVGKLRKLVERNGFRFLKAEGTGRVSRKIGTVLPIAPFYGSYMLVAEKA